MASKHDKDAKMHDDSSSEDEDYEPSSSSSSSTEGEEDIGSSSEESSDDGDCYIDEDGKPVKDMDKLHEKDAEVFLELDSVLRGMGLRRGWAPAYVENLKARRHVVPKKKKVAAAPPAKSSS
jgi:hypothetical protein